MGSWRQLTLKKIFMLWPKKNQTRNLITKKNSCGSKIPHPPLSNGPSLSDGEVGLGAHSFFPTPHPLKIYLCLVTMAYSCATFAGRVIQYTTQDKWKASRWTGKNASKFFQVNSLPQSLRTRGNWKSRILKMYCRGNRNVQCTVASAATLVAHRI